jgi:hypothetical protein
MLQNPSSNIPQISQKGKVPRGTNLKSLPLRLADVLTHPLFASPLEVFAADLNHLLYSRDLLRQTWSAFTEPLSKQHASP